MHHTTKGFWDCYYKLPKEIQTLADKHLNLLKNNLYHPSLKFKKIGELYSVRVGIHYRALGIEKDKKIYWFWIGNHREYEKIIKG